MKIYGLEIIAHNFNTEPDRKFAMKELKAVIENSHAANLRNSNQMTLEEKCNYMTNNFGYDALLIDAVRGSNLSFTPETAAGF